MFDHCFYIEQSTDLKHLFVYMYYVCTTWILIFKANEVCVIEKYIFLNNYSTV